MKQLRQARAKTQRLFLYAFAIIIALMCFASSPTIKAGAKSTGATTAIFMGGIGMSKFEKEDATEGGGSEKEAVLAEVKKNAEKAAKDFLEGHAEFKELKTFKDKFTAIEEAIKKAATPEDIKKLQEELKVFGTDIKTLKDVSVGRDRSVEKGSIKEIMLQNKAKIDALVSNKSGKVIIDDYMPKTLITKASETSTDIDGREAYFTWHQGGAVGLLPVRKPFIRELLTEVNTGTEFINFIDQDTIVRDAKNVALCGATSSNSKVTFKVDRLNIEKVRDFTDVCLDMMSDYTFVASQINLLLTQSLSLKIDNNLLFGDGNNPNPNGIRKYASTFAAFNADGQANYSAAIKNAQLIDLMAVAGLQIQAFGQQNMYNPNLIFMNPRDFAKIMFYKDTLTNYIKTPMLVTSLYTNNNGDTYINGMLVRTNPNVAANTAYVMDSTKATIYSKPGVGIEFAYENRSNFEQELVTVKVYERLNMLVRNVDKNAFLFLSDLNSDLAGITAP